MEAELTFAHGPPICHLKLPRQLCHRHTPSRLSTLTASCLQTESSSFPARAACWSPQSPVGDKGCIPDLRDGWACLSSGLSTAGFSLIKRHLALLKAVGFLSNFSASSERITGFFFSHLLICPTDCCLKRQTNFTFLNPRWSQRATLLIYCLIC